MIELLVVILIISLLLTLGAGVMRGIAGGNNMSSAVATSEALFDEARAIAVGKGTTACVLIDVNDPQDEDNYLRRLVVAYNEVDPQTGEPQKDKWAISSRGLTLPKGIYFSQKFSKRAKDQDTGLDDLTLNDVKELYKGKYLKYEFNSEGICLNAGASFVVGSGDRPLGDAPRVAKNGKRDFGGFVVWRNGRTSLFRDPEQVGLKSSQVSDF